MVQVQHPTRGGVLTTTAGPLLPTRLGNKLLRWPSRLLGIAMLCSFIMWVHVIRSVLGTETPPRQVEGTILLPSDLATIIAVEAKLEVFGHYSRLRVDGPNNLPVDMVVSDLSSDYNSSAPKGIALLLHGCSHSAFKFFSRNEDCLDCVGLAEELAIVRRVRRRGYIPVAVSSINRSSGCWSDKDIPRLRVVLDAVQQQIRNGQTTTTTSPPPDERLRVVAIGASSGGHMAAKVAADGLAGAALVMVMGLQAGLERKFQQQEHPRIPLYLAPMPRDQRTLRRTRENYHAIMMLHQTTSTTSTATTTHENNAAAVVLDELSCVPLPVTVDYLTGRVPGLIHDQAEIIMLALQGTNHLGIEDSLFLNDPTQSEWRNVLLELEHPLAGLNTADLLWGQLVLTRGQSPLAKAFHRAWAFHEYCSEAVDPALDFFELQFEFQKERK